MSTVVLKLFAGQGTGRTIKQSSLFKELFGWGYIRQR